MSVHAGVGLARREFLLAAGAGVIGLAGSRAADTPFGPFIVGAQSYTFRNFSLEKALAMMQELGLGYVEFATGHVPPSSTPEQLDAVRSLAKTYGVTPAAAGVLPFSKDIDQNRKHFELARRLGLKALSADPDPDAFDSLDKLCAEYQVAIAIHPHGPAGERLHRWYSAERILAAVKDHHPLIGSCLDTGHLIRSAQPPFNQKLDPAEQIRIMGKRNFGLHLKDHDNAMRTDVVFGKGVLDVPAVLKALREVGFTGMISIEYEANPDNPSADVRACLDVFEDAVAQVG